MFPGFEGPPSSLRSARKGGLFSVFDRTIFPNLPGSDSFKVPVDFERSSCLIPRSSCFVFLLFSSPGLPSFPAQARFWISFSYPCLASPSLEVFSVETLILSAFPSPSFLFNCGRSAMRWQPTRLSSSPGGLSVFLSFCRLVFLRIPDSPLEGTLYVPTAGARTFLFQFFFSLRLLNWQRQSNGQSAFSLRVLRPRAHFYGLSVPPVLSLSSDFLPSPPATPA